MSLRTRRIPRKYVALYQEVAQAARRELDIAGGQAGDVDRKALVERFSHPRRAGAPHPSTLYAWLMDVLGAAAEYPERQGKPNPNMAREQSREPRGPTAMVEMGVVPPRDAVVLRPEMVEGELRIRDLDLAARLGFADPHMIRRLIERHAAALAELGVSVTVTETAGPKGGRPGKAHFLSRKQAIFITAKSETAEATEITIEIIERFDAYERGAAQAEAPTFAVPKTLPEALRLAADQAELIEQQRGEIAERDAAITIMAPKADAMDVFRGSVGAVGVQIASKEMKVSQTFLVTWLVRNGWAHRRHEDGPLVAYRWVEQKGWAQMTPCTKGIDRDTGRRRRGTMFQLTPAGQAEAMRRILAERKGAPRPPHGPQPGLFQ